ncbi:MAG: RDD family protein [Gammaproteobacteria bacterium]
MHKASILRRLGALLYDSLASIALLMLATACWLPFYEGKAIPSGTISYQASLVFVLYLYFGYCWHRGQTVGMRAWRLYITNLEGGPVSFKQTVIRFVTAPLGIVTLLVGFPVHDRWSGTVLVYRKTS